MGFPGGASGKESTYQCRRHKRCAFNPWVGKFSWSRKFQPTLVFLPGKYHGQSSLQGYNPWTHKESDTNEHMSAHTHICTHTERIQQEEVVCLKLVTPKLISKKQLTHTFQPTLDSASILQVQTQVVYVLKLFFQFLSTARFWTYQGCCLLEHSYLYYFHIHSLLIVKVSAEMLPFPEAFSSNPPPSIHTLSQNIITIFQGSFTVSISICNLVNVLFPSSLPGTWGQNHDCFYPCD